MPADVAIIGGGASGLAAAVSAARRGDRVLVLERLNQIGKKLLATGNGRCNLLNRNPPVYYGSPDFARRVLGETPVETLEAFWDSLGLRIRYDREGRGYPSTMMAATVLEVLKAEMRRLGVTIRTGADVKALTREGDGFRLLLPEGEEVRVPRVIIATGGAAQPKLGGSLSAWPWLEEMGHSTCAPRPSLTPLRTEARAVSGLAGLRVRCRVALEQDGRVLHREEGEMLFTEDGVSGICVMQCARFLPEEGGACLKVNLIPGLFESREALTRDLSARAERGAREETGALLRGLCPPKLGYAVCKQAGLPLRGETNASLTASQLARVAETLEGYALPVLGAEGFDRAQVMAGGADCGEFDPRTMRSLRVPGLHVTGEMLNVDGDCGGYNLMFAFLSGLRAGDDGRRKN